MDNTCDVLADFIDIKSPFTWGHSKAVAEAADGIAKKLGLPESEAVHLRRAALVHDLGKVTVPCSAMEKEDGFTSDEWERHRLHAYYTERILSRVEPLRELGPDAVAHHEWVNGEGYHLQLKGDQTNLRQRILAVSDAYASLTDTGEAKMPPEMALDELKGSGGHQV
jgi:HD-GYP domain-containing protein (c-di-GMP phosphodiesterase class II)